ncbi:MAG: hypothetical protein KGS72_21520 [Cyanobacteria bacterium REEB67]|nr:hypothetical protein [Cyanobacteria bacterium REEB67]
MGTDKMNEDNPARINPALGKPPKTGNTGQKTNSTSGTKTDQRGISTGGGNQTGAGNSNKKGR